MLQVNSSCLFVSFLIYKMHIIIVYTSKGCCEEHTCVTPHLVRCPAYVNSMSKLSTFSPGSPPPATFPGPRSQCMLRVSRRVSLRALAGSPGLPLAEASSGQASSGQASGYVFQGCRTGQLSLLTRPSEPTEGPFCSARGDSSKVGRFEGRVSTSCHRSLVAVP